MKLTEKMKKNLAILGGVLIGIGLIAAIGMQFGPKPSGEDVLPGTGETELTVSVGLCFPRADGGGLGIEYRDVVQNEGDTMASTVFTALLEGPRYQELSGLMPEGTKLRGISVEGGVCTVNLSSEFLAGLPKEEQAARLLLYSIVDTLCMQEKLSISTVQLLSDGHAIESIGGVPASMPLEPDWTLLES